MMKLYFYKWAALALLGLCHLSAFAQAPEGWHFGTGLGAQRFANNVAAQLGWGVHASAGRWLAPRLGASLTLDYSALPFRQTVTASGVALTNSRESSLFGMALSFDYSWSALATINPYVKLGGGFEGMQVGNSNRQLYASGIAGAGVRLKVQPQVALHVQADYHLLNLQALSGFMPNQPPDGYFTARVGFTFFTSNHETSIEDWQSPAANSEITATEEIQKEEAETPSLTMIDSASALSEPNETELFENEFETEALPSRNSGGASLSAETFSDLVSAHSTEDSVLSDAAFGLSALEERLSRLENEYEEPAETILLDDQPTVSSNAAFDLSALEERLNRLENEYEEPAETILPDDQPTETPLAPAAEDFSALEARLQQLEQEYEFTASQEGGDNTSKFEDRLDQLASQYENPISPSNPQEADSFLDNLEEEPAADLTAFEQRLQILENEAEQAAGAPNDLDSDSENAWPSSLLFSPASNGSVAANGAPAGTILVKQGSFSQGYETALNSFYGGRYSEAILKLAQLVAEYPNHSLTSSCYYWIGEAQLQTDNAQDAIAAFSKVLDFERSLKKDNALLMLGRCYINLKRPDEARSAFNRVIAEYPGSEAVSKAQEYLRSL